MLPPERIELGQIVNWTANKDLEISFEYTDESLYVPFDLVRRGPTFVRGQTGSGKSARSMGYTGRQLIRHKDVAVFIADIGGDKKFFQLVSEAADATTFQWFSSDPRDDGASFDVFQVLKHLPTESSFSSTVSTALGTEFGMAYGASWFSQRAACVLNEIYRRAKREGKPLTMKNVVEIVEKVSVKDGDQAKTSLQMIGQLPQLLSSAGRPELNIEKAIDESGTVYLYLPSLFDLSGARLIAGMFVANLVLAQYERSRRNEKMKQVALFIDECQVLASPWFSSLLAQARKFNISIFLATQTSRAMELVDPSLVDTIDANAVVQLFLTVASQRDFDSLLLRSDQERFLLGGSSTGRDGIFSTENEREVWLPKLRENLIRAVSKTAGLSFACVDYGDGQREPVIIHTPFALSSESFQAPFQIPQRNKAVANANAKTKGSSDQKKGKGARSAEWVSLQRILAGVWKEVQV